MNFHCLTQGKDHRYTYYTQKNKCENYCKLLQIFKETEISRNIYVTVTAKAHVTDSVTGTFAITIA